MPGVEEIDRAVLWVKAREDKKGNIANPKVAEKARLIVSMLTELHASWKIQFFICLLTI